MATPDVGTPAPDFTLPGTSPDGPRDYTLSAERGHPVVLAFYPGDDTPVCTAQLCSYQADLASFAELDATLWGISLQDVTSHQKFSAKRGLTFPLLSDVDKTVHRQYGVLLPVLGTKRSVFVVDAEGVVRWKHVSTVGLTYQGVQELTAAVRDLRAASAT